MFEFQSQVASNTEGLACMSECFYIIANAMLYRFDKLVYYKHLIIRFIGIRTKEARAPQNF